MAFEEKQQLRIEAKKHRAQISPFDPTEDPEKAVDYFIEALTPTNHDIIALYMPKGDEFSTAILCERLQNQSIATALPRIHKDSRMLTFHDWNDGEPLETQSYDIMAPLPSAKIVTPTIMVVPLLAFDRKGYRLGFGGGYYDATIQQVRENSAIQTVGWGFAKQAVIFNLPREDHDQRLDFVITPQQIYDHRD
jgi:5-formyltetrahydrofolate cyclo-ligase